MYPIIYQENKSSCGPACIYMLCEYYHLNYDKKQILFHTRTSNKGTSIWQMREALHFLGFTSSAAEVISFTSYNLDFPIIALLMPFKDVYHYVIVYEKKATYVLVGDPANGLLYIEINKFIQHFTGMIIIPQFL